MERSKPHEPPLVNDKLSNQITVLVVDDEEHLRESIVFDFKRRGFKVLSAENGRQAFEMIALQTVDLVISDIRMPGGDGLELLRRLRGLDPSIPPMIFLTGFADISNDEMVALGAAKIMAKPFNRTELIDSVYQFTGVRPV